MIGKAIYHILTSNATVTGYVGTRIFPVIVPQTTERPCIAFRIVSNDPHETKQMVSKIDRMRFDLSIFTEEYDKPGYPPIYEIADAVRDALDKVTEDTYNGVTIGEMIFENEREGYEEAHESFVRTQTYGVFVAKS